MTTITLACAHCSTFNRIPRERLADKPSCGRCKLPVLSAKPVIANSGNFNNLVLKSSIPVVVDFWATWCAPCVQFAPTFEQAAARWEPRARFVKLETEAEQALAQRYAIRSIPTLMLFRDGKEIARQSGALPAQAFDQWLGQVIGSA
ncbi:thioredoxin TrxC [Aestuariirhabdus sp. Z084]|uniref:thioredoxin TrxC n=1 Tax=Aestuariirhabdus haliotis TaxID=2918751 RepID=UPI00201B43EC|nr:thioredoxin TrxC [Aestuariirhabdus haliotis]MCL6417660.1 thioredoxin TrxC [Aestuariirhabdus haliotis]MCL6421578.1 thioredoxin TrxC [Aestuariirhabdus haliotis]